jgi:hypothetical protein
MITRTQRWFDIRDASVEALYPNRGLVTVAEFAELEGRSVAEVAQDFAVGRLLGVEIDGELHILEAMIDPRIDRHRVARVSRALKPIGPHGRLLFFTSPKGSLRGLTPLAALLRGQVSETVKAARAYAER